MKKYIKFVAVFLGSSFLSNAFAFQVWTLVAQQFAGGTWYCTYQLPGSNPPITQTITSPMGCQGAITR